MGVKKNLVGKIYGRLTVVEEMAERNKWEQVIWKCVCNCGNIVFAGAGSLNNGDTTSCGCKKKEHLSSMSTKSGMFSGGASKTPEYNSWQSMKDRCNNPKASGYEHYGGRGITYDLRWESFENFLEDMGVRPEGTTLDRINVNGNYEPGNCRWATDEVQARNKRIRKDSLYPGVTFNTSNNNWRVRMFYNKKNIEIGQFDTFLDAVCAKMNYENKFRNEVN